MKVGDIVHSIDGSYSMEIIKDGVVSTLRGRANLTKMDTGKKWEYKILAIGCVLPVRSTFSYQQEVNDTIIRDTTDGSIFFTQLRFLQPITKHCEFCGHELP